MKSLSSHTPRRLTELKAEKREEEEVAEVHPEE
jgi:hypothetical protein